MMKTKTCMCISLLLLSILTMSVAESEIVYDTPEKLAESPIGSMYTKVVILKDDDWLAQNTLDWEKQKIWIKNVVDRNAKATLGVVANGLNPEPWSQNYKKQVKELGSILQSSPDDIELFCHGLTHMIVKNATLNIREFYKVPYADQNYSLFTSKQLVRKYLGYELIAFGPPGNTYDDNAPKAAKENGFLVFFGGPTNLNGSLLFVPRAWTASPSDFDKIQKAVNVSSKFMNKTPLLIETHSWEFLANQTEVYSEFLDYLLLNESRVFMTGYEYYKWYLDRGNITLTKADNTYVLDMSKTRFDHEVTFDRRMLEKVVVIDTSTNSEVPYTEINNRIVFKTAPNHVYKIQEQNKTKTLSIIAVTLIVLLVTIPLFYFKAKR